MTRTFEKLLFAFTICLVILCLVSIVLYLVTLKEDYLYSIVFTFTAVVASCILYREI